MGRYLQMCTVPRWAFDVDHKRRNNRFSRFTRYWVGVGNVTDEFRDFTQEFTRFNAVQLLPLGVCGVLICFNSNNSRLKALGSIIIQLYLQDGFTW